MKKSQSRWQPMVITNSRAPRAPGTEQRKNVAVLFGGRSVEHEISIISALQMMQAADTLKYNLIPVYISTAGRWYTGKALLDRNWYKRLPACTSEVTEVALLPIPGIGGLVRVQSGKPIDTANVIPVDVYFPCLHGTLGEDGSLQGLFELADVAYTGCDVVSAAVGMSKYHCKKYLESHNIPVLPGTVVSKYDIVSNGGSNLAAIHNRVRECQGLEQYPLFVKPASLGSSIGIAKVTNDAELDAALVQVFKYDVQALVEPCLQNKIEINVSVCGQENLKVSVVELPVASCGELTYADKYLRQSSSKTGQSRGMESLSRLIDPAQLDADLKEKAREYARQAYRYLGCSGVARVDFLVDVDTDRVYFNEINTLPGSLAFYLWSASNPCLLYTDLIGEVIDQAEHRKAQRVGLKRDIGFAALFS